jgi:hypothetical protein
LRIGGGRFHEPDEFLAVISDLSGRRRRVTDHVHPINPDADIDVFADVIPIATTNGATAAAVPELVDSWQPINLNTLPQEPPIRPDLGGVGIVYPGKRHVFSGPPESAKTLAAYAIAIAIIRTGGTVALIDFEMGSYDTRARLQELGATTDEISSVHYLEPHEPATEPRIATIAALKPQLVIIDAAAGAYDIQGLDDNKRGDVEHLSRLYVNVFWRAGIATIFIDHVVKNTETRGRFVIGSERKLGGADVHLGFDTITPISRGTAGHYKIVTHKDRGGWLKRGTLAELHLESDPTTHQISWAFKTPDDVASTYDYFRPTHLMEKVSVYLELQSGAVTRNTVCDAIGGTKKWVLAAIAALIIEGFAAEETGTHRAQPVRSIRKYRANDPEHNPENDATMRPEPVRASSEQTTIVRDADLAQPSGGSVVRGGSTVVREPDNIEWFGGSPPTRGDTTRTADPDQPNHSQWFDDLQPEPHPDDDIPF